MDVHKDDTALLDYLQKGWPSLVAILLSDAAGSICLGPYDTASLDHLKRIQHPGFYAGLPCVLVLLPIEFVSKEKWRRKGGRVTSEIDDYFVKGRP